MTATRVLFRAGLACAVLVAGAVLQAETGSVRITTTRANVRAEPNDKAAVIGQVTAGTVLILSDTQGQGDWYQVEVLVGGVRVKAWVSKKVAALVPSAPSEAAAPSAAPPPPPDPMRDGFSVTLQTKGASSSLFAETAAVHRIDAKLDSVRAAADLLKSDVVDASSEGTAPLTFAWALPGASAARALDDRRPMLVVTFTDVPGYSPENLTPALVRLSTSPSGVRVIALVRGSADSAAHTEADWDVVKTLKQDVVRALVTVVQPGGATITPASDLAPGEYAVVFRPASKKKLAGASVLRRGPEQRIFADAWAFSVK